MSHDVSSTNKHASGLTIVELMVALACFSIILSGIYLLFFQQNRHIAAEEEIIDLQLNGRVAMDRLNFIFRHAGFGCKDSFSKGDSMSGDDPDGSSVSIDSVLWDVQNTSVNGTNSDAVVVVYGFRKVAEVDGSHPNSPVNFKNIGSPSINTNSDRFHNYLAFAPDIQGNRVYRVTDASDPYDFSQNIDTLEDEAAVYMVVPVRVKVVDDVLYFQNFVYSSLSNKEDYWKIAEHVQVLQLQYTTDGSTWVDNPADPESIRGVQYFLLMKSERVDPDYTDTKSYTLAGQTVGPFQDHYHRKLFQGRVWLRN